MERTGRRSWMRLRKSKLRSSLIQSFRIQLRSSRGDCRSERDSSCLDNSPERGGAGATHHNPGTTSPTPPTVPSPWSQTLLRSCLTMRIITTMMTLLLQLTMTAWTGSATRNLNNLLSSLNNMSQCSSSNLSTELK